MFIIISSDFSCFLNAQEAGLIVRVESNQNVESKIKIVEPKDPFCGVHIDALVGCSATLVL
jgi:hypothetical protein